MWNTRGSSSHPGPALSAAPGSSQVLGLGLGGNPESGLSRSLSALQLIMSSGSPSHACDKFRLPTMSGEKLQPSSSSSFHLFLLLLFFFAPGLPRGFVSDVAPVLPAYLFRTGCRNGNIINKKKEKKSLPGP